MGLPTEKTPRISADKASMLLYGEAFVGKSTFASHAPTPFFFATEPGLGHLVLYQEPIRTWEKFLEFCLMIMKGNHNYETIVVDTLDMMYRFCADHICKLHGIKHESEGAHGKIYGLIKIEMLRVLTKLIDLPYGLILISHRQGREVKTPTGDYVKSVPALSEGFSIAVEAMVDYTLFCDVISVKEPSGEVVERRVLRTSPSRYHNAGSRFGSLPDPLPLDYAAFEKAARKAHGGENPTPEKGKEQRDE